MQHRTFISHKTANRALLKDFLFIYQDTCHNFELKGQRKTYKTKQN